MTTALSIINDALTELGVLADGETPTAVMSNDGLRALNRLCEQWSNEPAFAYANPTSSIALTGQSSFTFGPSGDLVGNRPIKIESAFLIRDGITYPVAVVDYPEWDTIAYKNTTGGNTTIIYYEPLLPDGVVYVWPLASDCTLYLRTTDLVTSFPDLSTDVTLAPGYEEYFIKNLAVDRAPSYRATVNPLTLKAAKKAEQTLHETNTIIPILQVDPVLTNNFQGGLGRFLGGY